jgi:hypothetical protein
VGRRRIRRLISIVGDDVSGFILHSGELQAAFERAASLLREAPLAA